MTTKRVTINRAPVLTLWATVVARRMGYGREAALTLGRAVAGLNAQSKGRRLGIFEEARPAAATPEGGAKTAKRGARIELMGRLVPAVGTGRGLRATSKGEPIEPESVERYLEQKFGEHLKDVESAMQALAKSYAPRMIAAEAFALYEAFRPGVPDGTKGWGAKGVLDLGKIRSLAKSRD
jgi:hypothetical protein